MKVLSLFVIAGMILVGAYHSPSTQVAPVKVTCPCGPDCQCGPNCKCENFELDIITVGTTNNGRHL